MEIDILYDISCPEVDAAWLRDLLETAVRSSGETDVELSVSLVNDDTIQDLSRRYLDKDAATDVISFPQRDESDPTSRHLGDIVISVDTARRQAALAGHSVQEEVQHLAEHGLLHLLGFEHHGADHEEWNRAAIRFGLSHHVIDLERTD
ncbi:MAG TPA: rRNA maturation RNase YbeY [bacterium]|nr:rRNA maturation RNase YbeY [bacterium]HQO36734.1 rRNA maturation RNase YbeY [bacterium]HQP97991.1 rRNA maturation RNase YbeY [bacterium]